MVDSKPTVATPSKAITEMAPDWELCEALLGGTREMRGAGAKYLPKWPNESQKDWECRVKVSVLFPAYTRTVQTLSAKPFSKPVTIGDDVPADLKQLLDDVDREGRNLQTFAADCMREAVGIGFGGILIDVPPSDPAAVRTQADEQRAGIRPYWVRLEANDIVGFKAVASGGQWKLTQLRFEEEVEEDDGAYATKCVKQIRVLEPGSWETHRKNEKAEWVLYEQGVSEVAGKPLDFIPFVPFYGDRCGFMIGRPPLLELAHLNVAHWQSASDQQNILHVARVPILTVIGAPEQAVGPGGTMVPWEFTIGASSAVKLPQGADMKFVEHTGAAIKAGADDLKALEDRMLQAGAEMLVKTQGQNTRIEAAANNEVATCALQRVTAALQDALNLALDFTARWMGKGPNAGGSVTLFSDFGALTLGDATAQLVSDMAAQGLISQQTAYEELQRRGVISGERTWEDEQDRKDAQGPALPSVTPPGGPGNGGGAGGSGAA